MGKIISPHVSPKHKKKKKLPKYLAPWVCPGCKGGKRIGVTGPHGNMEGDCLTCQGTGWIFDPVLMLGIATDLMADMGKVLHFLQEHLEDKDAKRQIGALLVAAGSHAQAVKYYFENFVALPEDKTEDDKKGERE